MDLKQLEYFVRVAELGSFTRAALALGVAQPALSRQVRLLEVELHQTLLTRNGRGASVTEAGRVLLEHGRGILHQVARAREDLGQVRGSLAGHVAIGLPPSVARVLAVPLTRTFTQALPQARLSVSEGLSVAMVEWLGNGRLDVALLYNTPNASGLQTTSLLAENLLLVQTRSPGLQPDPPPDPLPLEQVAALPLVIPSRPNAVRMQVEAELAAIGKRPHIALEIDAISAILDLVADGAGSAVLSSNAVASSNQPDAFSVRPIALPSGELLQSQLFLATSALRPATLTQQRAVELLRQTALQKLR